MNLRTSLPIHPFPFNLQHEDQVLSIGSCFAEEIAKKLNYYKFKITANPHGILYNPLSIIQCLNEIQSKKLYIEEDIFQNQEVWYSFQHHGKFSDLDPNVLIKQINKSIQRAAHALESSKLLICTLGTAFVYENKSDQRVVANCHKLPSDHFKKKLLKVETIVDAFEKTILSLSKQFPNINWLFTISPVRHLKDGFVENQRSKSTLHLAVHKLIEKFDHVHYFPSYEIVIDELRDYRFYNEDML
ncbi:MAG: GSCFA domain-containing protein, partial [Bacteroidota bacterium]